MFIIKSYYKIIVTSQFIKLIYQVIKIVLSKKRSIRSNQELN
jgi:hypothetical protein